LATAEESAALLATAEESAALLATAEEAAARLPAARLSAAWCTTVAGELRAATGIARGHLQSRAAVREFLRLFGGRYVREIALSAAGRSDGGEGKNDKALARIGSTDHGENGS
jgi:hypothetical protein